MIDHSFQLLACKYLHGQLEKLQKELAGAKLAEDIECVHQSRVATRRMRAGLNFFDKCFSSKKTKKWQGEIRKLTKKLGNARDADVHILFIEDFIKGIEQKDKQYKYGINRLLLRQKQRREKIQPKVIKSVNSFNASSVLADMHGEIEKILFNNQHNSDDTQSLFVFEHAKQRINKQLDELKSYESSLENPDDMKSHHQMRISAKRLRYTLEICDISFDGGLKDIIKAVKKVQTYLGDIHDCDVWCEYLEKFSKKEKELTIAYYGNCRTFGRLQKGLDHLSKNCAIKRKKLFDEFVKYYKQIEQKNVWDDLQSIIQSRIEKYREPVEIQETVVIQEESTDVNSTDQ